MKKETVRIFAFLALHIIGVIGTGMAFHLSDWKAIIVGCVALVMPIIWQVLALLAANGTISAAQIDSAVTNAIKDNPPAAPKA